MSRWYYSVGGKAEGPVATDFLLEGLRTGRLTLVDLVFREGDVAWCTLGEIPEFRDAFQAPPSPVVSDEVASMTLTDIDLKSGLSRGENTTQEVEWVVLQKKEHGYEQTGPFSVAQIIEKLGSGEIQYSQYVWRPGYKRWVRIGNLPEFDRRKRDRDGDPVNLIIPLPEEPQAVPALSREELMENVLRMEQPKPLPQVDDAAPEGTDGLDLLAGTRSIQIQFDPSPMRQETAVEVPVPSDEVTEPGVRIEAQQDTQQEVNPIENSTEEKNSQPSEVPRVRRPLATKGVRLFLAGAAAGLAIVAVLQVLSDKEEALVEEAPTEAQDLGEKPPEPKSEAEASSSGVPSVQAEPASQDPNLAPNPSATTEVAQNAPPEAVGGPKETQQTEDPPVRDVAPERATQQVVQEPVQQGPSAAPPAQAAKPPEQPESKTRVASPGAKPKTLEIKPIKLSSLSPQLVFETDVQPGEKIWVNLRARSGEILRLPSYNRTVSVTRKAGEVPSLDLSRLGLPAGSYRVEAVIGDLRKSRTIFVGIRDKEFEAELEKHLKVISHQQQYERKAIYYSARRYEHLARTLAENYESLKGQSARWKSFYESWLSDVQRTGEPINILVGAGSRANLAYPEELGALKVAADQLADQGKAMDQALKQRRDVASQQPAVLLKEFARLKQEAANLSARSLSMSATRGN